MRIVIAAIKPWNIQNAFQIAERYKGTHEIKIIKEKQDLSKEALDEFRPEMVFFPHWSYIIPAEIYENYTCIVFHMTDLPFGRGGSPLQNLIVRGIYETKVSAIRVVRELDAGPVYMKEAFLLEGSAQEIYIRMSDLIFQKMIPAFFERKLIPVSQQGQIVHFKRRTPKQSRIPEGLSLRQMYDYIRMLHAQGYPNAYIDLGSCRITFHRAQMEDGVVRAEAEIREEFT